MLGGKSGQGEENKIPYFRCLTPCNVMTPCNVRVAVPLGVWWGGHCAPGLRGCLGLEQPTRWCAERVLNMGMGVQRVGSRRGGCCLDHPQIWKDADFQESTYFTERNRSLGTEEETDFAESLSKNRKASSCFLKMEAGQFVETDPWSILFTASAFVGPGTMQ